MLPQLVRQCKSSFIDLLESGCIDLLLANEEEAATLAVEMGLAQPAGACGSVVTYGRRVHVGV